MGNRSLKTRFLPISISNGDRFGSQNKRDLTRQDRSVGFSFPTERSCPSKKKALCEVTIQEFADFLEKIPHTQQQTKNKAVEQKRGPER